MALPQVLWGVKQPVMSLPTIPDGSASAASALPPVDDSRKRRRVGEPPAGSQMVSPVSSAAAAANDGQGGGTASEALGPAVPQSMALLTNSALLEVDYRVAWSHAARAWLASKKSRLVAGRPDSNLPPPRRRLACTPQAAHHYLNDYQDPKTALL